MPVFTLQEEAKREDSEFVPIPVDTFVDLLVENVEQRTMPWQDEDGRDVNKVEFTFRVEGPDEWKGRVVKGQTSTIFSTNENCKLRNWSQEILGSELPTGFSLNTDDLIGLRVRGIVDQRKDKQDRIWNFVRDLIRTKDSYSTTDEPF